MYIVQYNQRQRIQKNFFFHSVDYKSAILSYVLFYAMYLLTIFLLSMLELCGKHSVNWSFLMSFNLSERDPDEQIYLLRHLDQKRLVLDIFW